MPDMPAPDQKPKPFQDRQLEQEDFWANAEILSTYTRAQALEDGVLVDVSKLAHEAGFRCPVAVTASLWADINTIPQGSGQDTTGRLWDVLFMGMVAIQRAVKQGGGDTDTLLYPLILSLPDDTPGIETLYVVKAVFGPGDDGSPVFTLMKPNED